MASGRSDVGRGITASGHDYVAEIKRQGSHLLEISVVRVDANVHVGRLVLTVVRHCFI